MDALEVVARSAAVVSDMFGTYVVGIGSFMLLALASWCVGEGGEILGQKYDASIIGGLVIAWLNTAPETIFFVTALDSNNPNFAMGAVAGSTIVVCTVALGACLYIGGNARNGNPIVLQASVRKQCMILGASVLIPLSIAATGFNVVLGALGVVAYLAFLVHSLTGSGGDADAASKKDEDIDLEVGLGQPFHEEEEEEEEGSVTKGALYLLAGGALIVLFSSPFINSVVEVAQVWHVSPTLLAFFLAPIASEAPEILESVSLSRKGNLQNINIAFSNLVGGTITKTTLLSGILCMYGISREYQWESPSYTVSLVFLALCAAVAAGIGCLPRQEPKHGIVLFVCFAIAGIVQYIFNAGSGMSSFELLEAARTQ